MEHKTIHLDEYLIKNKNQPFPFRKPGEKESQISKSMATCFPAESDQIPQMRNLPTLLAINYMFGAGQDDYAGAKAALLQDALKTDPIQAYAIGKTFGLEKEGVDAIGDDFNSLEHLIAQPKVTINDVADNLTETIYPIMGFITRELSEISLGIKKPDAARLHKLAYIVELYFARANDRFEGNWSTNGELSAMIGCLKDVAFWSQYPETFALMSQIIYLTSGVTPEERYSYAQLTSVFTQALTGHTASTGLTGLLRKRLLGQKLISEEDIRTNKVRIIGNIKPISRAVVADLKDKTFAAAIVKAANAIGLDFTPPLNDQDVLQLFENTLQSATNQNIAVINGLLQDIRVLRWMGYDQRRCRIQVADPVTFDKIVGTLHRRIQLQQKGASFGRRLFPHSTPLMYNINDYLRTSVYDGTNPPVRVPIQTVPKHPSKTVITHVRNLGINQLGYAAYHQHGTLLLGIRPTNCEIQVTLGKGAMEQMNKMAALALATRGNFDQAGLTAEYIRAINERAKLEAHLLGAAFV